MRLSSLLKSLPEEVRVISEQETDDPEIARVVHDSRTVEPGDLFCCVRGARHDAALGCSSMRDVECRYKQLVYASTSRGTMDVKKVNC